MERLMSFFTNGAALSRQRVGIEVETLYVDTHNHSASLLQTQKIFQSLCNSGMWRVHARKGNMISEIIHTHGHRLLYELAQNNIEFASAPLRYGTVVPTAIRHLERVEEIARVHGLFPLHKPISDTGIALAIPDARDKTWVEVDGRNALTRIASCASVQFTIDVNVNTAIDTLNTLGAYTDMFLAQYPQHALWLEYITHSRAGYARTRYGGFAQFAHLRDYCNKLSAFRVINSPGNTLFTHTNDVDIPLYVRSVWWHFRLKRYNQSLCVEIRPLPRLHNTMIYQQWALIREILSL